MKIVVAMLAVLAVAGCAVHEGVPGQARRLETAAFKVAVQRNMTYTPANWPARLKADVYLPRGIGPYPVIVVVHGGGWSEGNREDAEDTAEMLAGRGYAAVAVDYRSSAQARFPAQLHDLQIAVRWIRSKSETYQFDARRVGVFGEEAGAHLAALLGTVGDRDPLNVPHGGPDSRVQAVVAGGGAMDLRTLTGIEDAVRLVGGAPAEKPHAYALASPITHVSADDAPFFLFHGEWGGDVPIAQAEAMKSALERAGVPVELYRLRVLGQFAKFFSDDGVVREAMDFFDRHLRKDN